MKKMLYTLSTLWTPLTMKLGVLFSFLWLCVDHIVVGFDEQITALCLLLRIGYTEEEVKAIIAKA